MKLGVTLIVGVGEAVADTVGVVVGVAVIVGVVDGVTVVVGVTVIVTLGVGVCVGVGVTVGLNVVIQFFISCIPPYPLQTDNNLPSTDNAICLDGYSELSTVFNKAGVILSAKVYDAIPLLELAINKFECSQSKST